MRDSSFGIFANYGRLFQYLLHVIQTLPRWEKEDENGITLQQNPIGVDRFVSLSKGRWRKIRRNNTFLLNIEYHCLLYHKKRTQIIYD